MIASTEGGVNIEEIAESNPDAIQKVTELYDVQGVLGLASHPNVLEDAGIKDADMIIAVTQSDEINIAACHIAKSIFSTPTMIIRIRSKAYLEPRYVEYLLKDVKNMVEFKQIIGRGTRLYRKIG